MTEKTAPVAPVLDLFGQPWLEPRDPRGRKSHRWSMEVAESIALLKATGATDPEVAVRVGMSLPTLKKYYFRELDQGAALVRQAVLKAQLGAALKGSSSAAKVVLSALDKGELLDDVYRPSAGVAATAPKAAPLGKKEQRQAAAENVGGIYAPGAPPPTVTH